MQSFELMFTWDLMDVQKVLELSLSSPLTMLAMQSSNLTVMTGKVALSRFARIGLLVPVAVVVLVVVSVAVVDSETVADVVVAVDVEVTEEAVVAQPTGVALGTSRARSRLFKSSTLPHTNFYEVRR